MARLDSDGTDTANSALGEQPGRVAGVRAAPVPRISSTDLLGAIREIEIDHGGRIYRLRLTQSNKLILTA